MPSDAPYYAGHFRGEPYKCLEYCNVGVGQDKRVGVNASLVRTRHADMISKISIAISQIEDVVANSEEDPVSNEELLQMVVPLAANFLQLFLTLHPYVNGNGHMGRAIVWVLFARFGIWPQSWPLDTSPPYHDLLSKHRDGGEGRKHLEDLLYRAISGDTLPAGPNPVADQAWLDFLASEKLVENSGGELCETQEHVSPGATAHSQHPPATGDQV